MAYFLRYQQLEHSKALRTQFCYEICWYDEKTRDKFDNPSLLCSFSQNKVNELGKDNFYVTHILNTLF